METKSKDQSVIAVLADIHANDVALRAVLRDAKNRGATEYWLLGDYVGDHAGVRETMLMLNALKKENPCIFIRGNKEDYWLGDEASRSEWRYGNNSTGTMLYTYNNLTPEDLKSFSAMPISITVRKPDLPPVLLCHGRPTSNRMSLKDNDDTRKILENTPEKYVLCGHTHIRMTMTHAGVTLINAGSVGVSLNAGRAEYVLMTGHDGGWEYEFISLGYDTDKAIEKLYAANLDKIAPCWTRSTVSIVRYGKPKKTEVVEAVMDICNARYGKTDYSKVPDDCWADALNALGIE